ncbi:PE family protein, partial [Mycobacterium asiaticum]|uniref:PE family protein n=1 Tax=Mycobacterium asiaticum TaxID=1790 RepID=UPI0012DB617D
MPSLIAIPEMMTAAATELQSVNAALIAANTAAKFPTVGLLAAGADEISAAVTALFSNHG